MESCVQKKLNALGYTYYEKAYAYINIANTWYRNEIVDDFHKRTSINGEKYEIDRMNFAKRGCADDANLCEVVSINVGEQSKDGAENTQSEEIKRILRENQFDTMYRQQLERMSATGTVGAYIVLQDGEMYDDGTVKHGRIKINYCFAENYMPLRVVNGEVIEAAFSGTDITKNGKQTTLVLFLLVDGKYVSDTYIFDNNDNEISNSTIQLGEVKPFEVMRVAEVNNIRGMNGFGYPKVYGAIPTLKEIDLCNMVLNGDLSKGEKYVITNEAVVETDPTTGKPKERDPMWKKLFVFLGKKPIDGSGYIQEYNPKIRVEEITKSFELCLSLFSMTFGFGSKKYTFENGQIQTATQYIGEKQDSMQELNKQRKEAENYISHLVLAMEWFSNTFCGTSFDLESEICIDFDDSFIEDKNSKIESMRADAQTFSDIPEFTIRYIMERFNVDRDEALKIYENRQDEDDEEESITLGLQNQMKADGSEDAKVSGTSLNGAQTQSLIAIMGQYTNKTLTEGQAINLIAQAIGISKDDARNILSGTI